LRHARRIRRISRRYGSRAIRAPVIRGYFVTKVSDRIIIAVLPCAECRADGGFQVRFLQARADERVMQAGNFDQQPGDIGYRVGELYF